MFAGHIGAGLAIGRADRRINVGVLISAALLLDGVLWLFILLGWESVSIPADFPRSYQPHFNFPYSHSLLGSLVWSVFAALAAYWWLPRSGGRKLRAAALIGAAAFSHWLLDALVHAPELPLAGPQSRLIGWGLWDAVPLALTVEGLVVAAGLWLYLPRAPISRGSKCGVFALGAMALGFTIVGMTVAPPPPSADAMAAGSLTTISIVAAVAWWLGRIPGEPACPSDRHPPPLP
jgi:membrane-bound metal-dependent hydrolase YbcI (DUF457 family)